MHASAFQMKIISRFARLFKSEYLQELGLSHRESEVLLALERQPSRSQDDISDILLIDKSSVTRCLAALEEKGLVTRAVNPADRRATSVALTDAALALAPKIREINGKWSTFMQDAMTEEEWAVFHTALEKVFKNVRSVVAERRKKP